MESLRSCGPTMLCLLPTVLPCLGGLLLPRRESHTGETQRGSSRVRASSGWQVTRLRLQGCKHQSLHGPWPRARHLFVCLLAVPGIELSSLRLPGSTRPLVGRFEPPSTRLLDHRTLVSFRLRKAGKLFISLLLQSTESSAKGRDHI